MLGIFTNINCMKKQYTFILQVLLICLIAAKGSIASNVATTKTLHPETTIALDIECPDSFTESATPSCEFILPDYTSLALITGAGAEPVVTKSPLPSSLYGIGVITVTLTTKGCSTEGAWSFDLLVIDTTYHAMTCPVMQFCVR